MKYEGAPAKLPRTESEVAEAIKRLTRAAGHPNAEMLGCIPISTYDLRAAIIYIAALEGVDPEE